MMELFHTKLYSNVKKGKVFMDDQEIMLSIICTTYNHGPYLCQALNSILMQKTKYKYEVLIGEDCSTDNSREIIKKFEEKYPEKFKVFYRENNYGSSKNSKDLYARAVGKYVISLETDDFWIDENKIQRQIDFLESNPEYVAVAHRCIMIDQNNEILDIKYPECDKKDYTLKEFRKGLLAGQTATQMCKNYRKYDVGFNCSLIIDPKYSKGPGDVRRMFAFASNAKIACLPEVMSVYRFVPKGGSSYTANQKKDVDYLISNKKCFIDYARNFVCTRESIYTAEYILFDQMLFLFMKRKLSFSFVMQEWTRMQFKMRVLIRSLIHCNEILWRKWKKDNGTYTKISAIHRQNLVNRYSLIIDELKRKPVSMDIED